MAKECLSPLRSIWFLGCRHRNVNNLFSGCHGGKGWKFWELGAMVGFPPNNSESYWKVGRESVVLSPLWVRINRWLWRDIEGSSECEMGFRWVPGAPGEGDTGSSHRREGFGLLGPLGGRSLCAKEVWQGVVHLHKAKYEGCTSREWGRGDVRRRPPWLWLKDGNWRSREILEAPLTLVLEVRVFHFHFSSSVY